MKKILACASVVALMSIPAIGQDNAQKTEPAAQEMTKVKNSGQLPVNDLINKSVKNSANETVGDINDVRISNNGEVAAVIIGVGGFLGIGEKDVAVSFDQLSFKTDEDGGLVVTANVTKESLQAAPEWTNPADRT